MGNFITRYHGVSERGPSLNLWHDCPLDEARNRPGFMYYDFDDFQNCPRFASTVSQRGYYSFQDTGVTIQGIPTEGNIGVLEIAGNDADNDEGYLTAAGNTGAEAIISDTSGSDLPLWFECRIKKASIANNSLGFFVGLAEEGLAAQDTLVADTAEVASKDLIGFQVLQAAGGTVLAIYRKAGQNKQTVLSAAHTLVADTYVKLGFKYNPWDTQGRLIRFFVNGIEDKSGYVSAANIAAATFPDGEELVRLLACRPGTDMAESKMQMDWWAVAQLLP